MSECDMTGWLTQERIFWAKKQALEYLEDHPLSSPKGSGCGTQSKMAIHGLQTGGDPITTEPSTGMIEGVKVGEKQICLAGVLCWPLFGGHQSCWKFFIEFFPDEIDLGGWWFQNIVSFSFPIWERFPFWRAYFSKGLVQPPTRDRIGHQQMTWGFVLQGFIFVISLDWGRWIFLDVFFFGMMANSNLNFERTDRTTWLKVECNNISHSAYPYPKNHFVWSYSPTVG